MTVCVCIATRGRPELISRTVKDIIAKAERPDTRIVIGLDVDDYSGAIGAAEKLASDQVIVSVADREDSLGAKYNRCAAQCVADLYVIWADDTCITTPGWDVKLEDAAAKFPDGMGVVYFADIPGTLQTGIAVTRKFMEKMGFFCTPYFPYWWHDTWIDEVGRLSGRIVHADVNGELLQVLKKQSRGVREIAFWGTFFEKTRPWRRQAALGIIEEGCDPPFRKEQQIRLIPSLEALLSRRNGSCTDRGSAAELERHYSFDAPADERYLRIKKAAIEYFPEMAEFK